MTKQLTMRLGKSKSFPCWWGREVVWRARRFFETDQSTLAESRRLEYKPKSETVELLSRKKILSCIGLREALNRRGLSQSWTLWKATPYFDCSTQEARLSRHRSRGVQFRFNPMDPPPAIELQLTYISLLL